MGSMLSGRGSCSSRGGEPRWLLAATGASRGGGGGGGGSCRWEGAGGGCGGGLVRGVEGGGVVQGWGVVWCRWGKDVRCFGEWCWRVCGGCCCVVGEGVGRWCWGMVVRGGRIRSWRGG